MTDQVEHKVRTYPQRNCGSYVNLLEWRSLGSSSCRLILDLRLSQNLVPNVFAQETRRIEVYFPSKKKREFAFNGKEIQPDRDAWLKLDEHVNITVFIEVVAKDRTEQANLRIS